MGNGSTGRIFVSYRRDETRYLVGRLGDLLAGHFGADKVFVDVDSIPAGVDFAEEIERELSTCAVLLVIIGPGWLSAADTRGRHRLDDPDDFVVLEIKTALDRNIRVIPVLVDGALMPRQDELPAELANLTRRHAVRLDHDTFRSDVSSLLTQLDIILDSTIQTPQQDVVPSHAPVRSSSQGQLKPGVRSVLRNSSGVRGSIMIVGVILLVAAYLLGIAISW